MSAISIALFLIETRLLPRTSYVKILTQAMMKSEVETQPFLAFSDDPAGQGRGATGDRSLPPHRKPLVKVSNTRRLLRDFAVCLATSLLWVLVIWMFIPGPAPTSSSSSTSSPANDDAAPAQMPSQGSSAITGEDMARFHNITSGAKYISCGNSTEEARSNGCTYDTLLNAWVPAQCLDQEWIDEYQDDASWTAFSECVSDLPVPSRGPNCHRPSRVLYVSEERTTADPNRTA